MASLALYRRPRALTNPFEDMDRYLENFFGDSPLLPNIGNYGSRPAVDIKETDTGYEVDAELPGMDEDKVQVNVEGRTLTIESKDQGEKNVSPDKEGKNKKGEPRYLLRERYQYNFSRSFQLPEDADLDKIEAQFKDGLLKLEIQKKPTSQKKAISIKKA